MNKLPFEENKKILIKREAETNKDLGCKPEERKTEEIINYGIINLNKPSGPTSHLTTDYVKKILNINKAGHSGSLDPKVTGVLPIALGRATRIVQTLLKSGKEYVGVMRLHKEVSEKEIFDNVEKFIGKIEQLPPVRSAVKRRLRERSVYYFKILEIDGKNVLFRVGVEAGTYIRKLIHDFSKELEINGHMSHLVRTRVACFSDKDWVSLHDLKDAYELYKSGDDKEIRKIINPVEKGVEHLNNIWVNDNCVDTLCHGADLNIPGIVKLNEVKKDELVAIMTLKDELVCLGICEMDYSDVLKNEKGKVVKTKKVFMGRGLYKKV